MEQQPAEESGENGLQAHQQGRRRRGHPALAHDLQRIGHAHGENAGIGQGHCGGEDILKADLLRQQGKGQGKDRHHSGLDAVELHPVQLAAVPVDQQDLHGEGRGAAEKHQVSFVDAAAARPAQKIQAHNGGDQAQHRIASRLLAGKKPQKGDEHNVHGGKKAGLSGIGIHQAHLLEAGRNEKSGAADQTGAPQAGVGPLLLPQGGAFFPVHKEGQRKQKQHGQAAAEKLEGKGPDGIHAHALGNKGGAPDQRGAKQRNHAK